MPDDPDFSDLAEPLEKTGAYILCVLGAIAIPTILLSMKSGAPGALLGAGLGAVIDLKFCPTFTPAIRHKIFSPSARLTPAEFRTLVRQFKQANPRLTTGQALDLIAMERLSVLGGRSSRA